MKIALYGGAFDPIHNGHLEVIQALRKSGLVDEVWVATTHKHIHGKHMENSLHRSVIVAQAIEHMKKSSNFASNIPIRVCLDELLSQGPKGGATYDWLKYYEDANPGSTISPVIGMDNANSISSWWLWDRLITEYSVIIIPRPGDIKIEDAWYTAKPHSILNVETPDISSTKIRGILRLHWQNKTTSTVKKLLELMPDCVVEHILSNNLYR